MEITKGQIVSLYIGRGLGLKRMAIEFGVGVRVVRTLMDKYEIERRPFHLKGRQGSRLGAVLTDETKRKISESHQGKTLSPEHRAKVVKTLRYGLKGHENPGWKGGLSMHDGYVTVRDPLHPKSYANGYVKRAVLVSEKKLGRSLLNGEVTHHINGIRDDDRPENIEVLSASSHNTITMKNRWESGEMYKYNNRKPKEI